MRVRVGGGVEGETEQQSELDGIPPQRGTQNVPPVPEWAALKCGGTLSLRISILVFWPQRPMFP